MTNRTAKIPGIATAMALAAGLALTTALAACGTSSQAADESSEDTTFVRVVNVEVRRVEPMAFTTYIRITGEVEALNDVTVSAEESGRLARYYREKGESIQRGEVLAKIDDRVLRAQVEEAAASAKLAAERYERQRRLWEEEGIGSEMNYLEARYRADLEAARLRSLEARLARTSIVAPISGVFDERFVDAGEMVAPGTSVARIVEVRRLKVVGGVPERFAGSVSAGDSARIGFDVLPGQEFVGVIAYVGTAVEPQSRTFPIEMLMDNPDRAIKPHMIANVEVTNQRLVDAVVVPQQAIIRTEQGYQVYVVAEGADGVPAAEAREVRLGPSYANQTVIESGLVPNDRVIVRGQQMVDPGDRVRVVAGGESPRVEPPGG